MDQEYRQSKINKLLEQLNNDLSAAEKQYKKHKSKGAHLEKAEYSLTGVVMVTGISVISTLASLPVGIALGVVSGVCGIADMIVKTIKKKNAVKTQKWHDMCDLIADTHSKINVLVSDALDDVKISDNEFSDIIGVYDTYRAKLTALRNEYLPLENQIKLKK